MPLLMLSLWFIIYTSDCMLAGAVTPRGGGVRRGKTGIGGAKGKRVFAMFNIGDRISHPMHGAGVIDGIEERKINGTTRRYYVFRLPAGGMLVMIPVDNCECIGVRPIISASEADRLLESLSGLEIDATQNWNRRYRENMLRIRSGNLLEVARVIKSLMARELEKGLSTGERKMLRSAKQILISELVLSKSLTYGEAEERLNIALS